MPKNWNRRFKHNRDKIKTGDIYGLEGSPRSCAISPYASRTRASRRARSRCTRAKKILASEMMYALEKTEEEAEAYLDDLLQRWTSSWRPQPGRRAATRRWRSRSRGRRKR